MRKEKVHIDKKLIPWPLCKLPNLFIRLFIFLWLPVWIYEDLKEQKTIKYWWDYVTAKII